MKFLSPVFALYLYKSTIRPCMEYCCQIWAAAPSCYFGILRQATKVNMQDCWSFTCCFSLTLGSLSKCGQLVFSIGITLVDAQNLLKWYHFFLD